MRTTVRSGDVGFRDDMGALRALAYAIARDGAEPGARWIMHRPSGAHAAKGSPNARLGVRSIDRRRAVWVAAAVLVGLFTLIAVRNAFTYPSIGGYDAAEHIAYARSLVEDGEIPRRTGTYYTPPLWYALAGSAIQVGEAIGLDDPEHMGQLLNALLVAATAVLVLALAGTIFPGRPLLALAALAFFIANPLTLRMATMFHPQALVLFLSTAGLLLVARMVARRRYGLAAAATAGVLLGAAELVRSVGIWSYGVGVIVLLAAVVLDRERRRRAAAALAIVLALGVLVPLPWYAYLQHTYGYAVFGRPATGDLPAQTPGGPPPPVPAPAPAPAPAPEPPPPAPRSFYFGTGLPEVITQPHRDALPRDFFPIVYADTWGDVFGSWTLGCRAGEPRQGGVSPRRPVRRRSAADLSRHRRLARGRRPRAAQPSRPHGAVARARATGGGARRDALLRRPLVRGRGGLREGHVRPHRRAVLGTWLRARRRWALVPRTTPGRSRDACRRRPCARRLPGVRLRMSEISGQRAAEWPSLRLGLAGAVALVLLVLAGWAREEAFIDEPTRLEQTERCLKREKLLQVGPVEHDPIAARASGGALATRVEGNGVRILHRRLAPGGGTPGDRLPAGGR